MSSAHRQSAPPPAKILVADDDDDVRTGLVANLELEGYQVSEARDGAEAIQMLSASVYDLILSDVVMPSATGIQVLSAARSRQSDTPFILISGFVSDELVGRALGEGLFTMLYKPLEMGLTLQVVARALRRSTVLIVVDARPNLASLAVALRAASVRVETCADGPSAVAYAQSHSVDVCVLELAAQSDAGLQVCAALRNADPSLKIIAITTCPDEPLGPSLPAGIATLQQPVGARDLLSSIGHARATAAANR